MHWPCSTGKCRATKQEEQQCFAVPTFSVRQCCFPQAQKPLTLPSQCTPRDPRQCCSPPPPKPRNLLVCLPNVMKAPQKVHNNIASPSSPEASYSHLKSSTKILLPSQAQKLPSQCRSTTMLLPLKPKILLICLPNALKAPQEVHDNIASPSSPEASTPPQYIESTTAHLSRW